MKKINSDRIRADFAISNFGFRPFLTVFVLIFWLIATPAEGATTEEIPGQVRVKSLNGKRYVVDCPTMVLTGTEAIISPPDFDPPSQNRNGETQQKGKNDDASSLLPEWKQTCASGDLPAIQCFLKQHPDVVGGTFLDGSLRRNALSVAIDEAPYGEQRIEILRFLVKKGTAADYVDRREDPRMEATYNAVSYPENLSLEELDFLLRSGADPDLGVCAPGEPPLVRLCKMFLENKTDIGKAKIAQEGVIDRIRVFVKHGADADKKAKIGSESARQLALDSGSAPLKSALGIKSD